MCLDNFINIVMQNINAVYSNYIAMFILSIFMIFNSYTDIKKLKIYNVSNVLLLVSRIILIFIPFYSLKIGIGNLFGMIFSFLVILIPAMMFMFKMGGDIKFIAVIGFFLGFNIMPLFIILSCISALFFGVIKYKIKGKVGKIPFAPFFFIAHIIIFIISLFI